MLSSARFTQGRRVAMLERALRDLHHCLSSNVRKRGLFEGWFVPHLSFVEPGFALLDSLPLALYCVLEDGRSSNHGRNVQPAIPFVAPQTLLALYTQHVLEPILQLVKLKTGS